MTEKGFNWVKFQKHLGYTDMEMAQFKADPHRCRGAQKIFSREIASKLLIIEVVHSHGCSAGMKVGDLLVFKALSIMDHQRSSPWCAQALGEIGGFANMVHDRFASGLDPNEMLYNHFSCMDAGAKFGWGQVIMKAYIIDEKDFTNKTAAGRDS
jgi:uncharacterized repeat protein (TIGR04076 family)